jgi:hypothetical protein
VLQAKVIQNSTGINQCTTTSEFGNFAIIFKQGQRRPIHTSTMTTKNAITQIG